MDEQVNAIAQELEELSNNIMVRGVSEELRATIDEVRQAAIVYCNILKNIEGELNNFKNLLKKQKEIRKSNINYKLLDTYLNNQIIIRGFLQSQIPNRLYKASFEFQNILNNALGQEVKMIYVYDDGSGPELYEMKSHEVLSYEYSSRGQLTGRYNITANNITSVMEKMQIASENIKFNLTELKNTYKDILYRYNIARQHKWNVVLWKPDAKWHGMSVSSVGDINEAYAVFILLNNAIPSFNLDREHNVGDFLQQGVANVDNASGLLQGDLTMNNINYGIKSLGASTLGLKQIEKLAQKIISDSSFNIEKLQQEIKAGRKRNKSIEYVENKFEDLINILRQNKNVK